MVVFPMGLVSRASAPAPRLRRMTDSSTAAPSTPTSARRDVAVPDKPALEGLEEKWAQRWKEQETYRFDRTTRALHDRAVSGPHFYLFILGAYPMGRGEGDKLLRPGLARADRECLPCYLETTAPRALPFYLRHGFQLVAESRVPRGPHLWGLLRPAATRQMLLPTLVG